MANGRINSVTLGFNQNQRATESNYQVNVFLISFHQAIAVVLWLGDDRSVHEQSKGANKLIDVVVD